MGSIMQKWEYCLLWHLGGYIYRNGKKVSLDIKITLDPREALSVSLQKLGEGGWEVVSVEDGYFVLKRPIGV